MILIRNKINITGFFLFFFCETCLLSLYNGIVVYSGVRVLAVAAAPHPEKEMLTSTHAHTKQVPMNTC